MAISLTAVTKSAVLATPSPESVATRTTRWRTEARSSGPKSISRMAEPGSGSGRSNGPPDASMPRYSWLCTAVPPWLTNSWLRRASKRPVEAIKQKKVEPSEAGEPPRRRPRSLFHRVAPGVVMAVVVAGVVRRRTRGRIAT